jgi:PAS domain-containing protein
VSPYAPKTSSGSNQVGPFQLSITADPDHSLGNCHVDERMRAEAALRDSERRYRLLAENVSDVISTLTPDLRVEYVSPSIFRLRGYTVEEIVAQKPEERKNE